MNLPRQLLIREECAVILAAVERILERRAGEPPPPKHPWKISIAELTQEVNSTTFPDRMIGRRIRKMHLSTRLDVHGRTDVLIPQNQKLYELIPGGGASGVAWGETVPEDLVAGAEKLLALWEAEVLRPKSVPDEDLEKIRKELLAQMSPEDQEEYKRNMGENSMAYFGKKMGE